MSILNDSLIHIYIDGQEYVARQGDSVLNVAIRYGLNTIPHLCYHPALKAEASCRLCVVTVEGDSHGLKTACTLRTEDGMRVLTGSEEVITSRRQTLSFLLRRAPASRLLQSLATKYGVEKTLEVRAKEETGSCLLCGLCVRVCRKLGVEALQFVGKGKQRRVELVSFTGDSPCISCHACEKICPVNDVNGGRSLPRKERLQQSAEVRQIQQSKLSKDDLP